MGMEYQVVGPPGCGKTTYVVNEALRAIEASGLPAQECREVLITTLTMPAAA
jgi:hypothetical protein